MSPGNLFHYFPNKQAIVEEQSVETASCFEELIQRDDLHAALLADICRTQPGDR